MTAHLTLARAAESFRQPNRPIHPLSGILSPAQRGAAIPLLELGLIVIHDQLIRDQLNETAKDIRQQIAYIDQLMDVDTESARATFLREVLADWLTKTNSDPIAQSSTGYWLMRTYLRGMTLPACVQLTTFLIGEHRKSRGTSRQFKTIRRYPTGGISEKQALILPAMLQACADEASWASPFLVARRLAHTGGTRDKLRILPGMTFASLESYSDWNYERNPVRYFTAGEDFCPRDAELYRLRGETGTVSDTGLMAASIMSKQIALPADVVLVDILFGHTAFLKDSQAAHDFGVLCKEIGSAFGACPVPVIREAERAFGNCIGNVTEIIESIELLSPDPVRAQADWLGTDVAVSLDFVGRFAEASGYDPAMMRKMCKRKIVSGEMLQHLIELWRQHGVETQFLEKIKCDPRSALTTGLQVAEVRSNSDGILPEWDEVVLADYVNNGLNAYKDNIDFVPTRGGIEFCARSGAVSNGDIICRIYSEVSANAWIEKIDRVVQPSRPDIGSF